MTSRNNDIITTDFKKAEQSIFYYSSWVTFLSSLLGQLFIVILLFSTFKDQDNKLVQVVNSFYSTYDPTQVDPTWQVASMHWGLPSGAIVNPSVTTYSPYYTDEIITPMTECMYSAQIGSNVCKNTTLNDYYKCINNNFVSGLSTCNGLANRQFLYPIRQEYAECIWKKVGSNKPNNLTVLTRCMDITFWPIYEVIQDVDSKYFLGSYNWAHFVLIGFFLFANLLMYSSFPINDSKIRISNFKPAAGNDENSFFVRGSLGQAFVCFAVLIFVFIIQVTLFSGNSPLWFDNYGFPSSSSTLILVLTFTVGMVIYYILEIAEFYQSTSPTMFKGDYERVAPDETGILMSNIPVAFQMQAPNLAYFASKERSGTLYNGGSLKTVGLLGSQQLKTWADANVTNILFFIGVIGCTMQVNVIEIYNVFSLLLVLRLIDMTFARMNFSNSFSEDVYRVSLRFASLLATIVLCMMIWNTNKVSSESAILTAISVLCIFIPEVLKFIYEIFIQMVSKDNDYSLLYYNMYFYQFICAWNILLELIFVIVIFWGNDAYGNLSFLKNKHQNLIVWLNLA